MNRSQQPGIARARRRSLLPSSAAGPGQVLWAEPARRQPIVPLLAMAILVLLVAAPAAMSGNGSASNPLVLMSQTAESIRAVTTIIDEVNGHLKQIDQDATRLPELSTNMEKIGVSSQGMAAKTGKLNSSLTGVASSVGATRTGLASVSGKLSTTATGIGGLSSSLDTSLAATKGMVSQFDAMNSSIGRMDSSLESTIGLMSVSKPLTTSFATNTTRQAIVGGNSSRYGVPNVLPGTRVMSVVLPMITSMQQGGSLALRKDSATGSNAFIQAIVNRQIPDGSNLVVRVEPFDGRYGMPGAAYFVNNRVGGF